MNSKYSKFISFPLRKIIHRFHVIQFCYLTAMTTLSDRFISDILITNKSPRGHINETKHDKMDRCRNACDGISSL